MPGILIPRKKPTQQNFVVFLAFLRANLLLSAGLVSAVIVGLLYGGLFFTASGFKKDIQGARARYDALFVDRKMTDQEGRARAFGLRANALQSLLDSHVSASRLFPYIEDATHPRVILQELSVDFSSGKVQMGGTTDSYKNLAEQLLIVKSNPLFRDAQLTNFATENSGRLRFSITFVIPIKLFLPAHTE